VNAAAKDMMCARADPDAKPYEVLYFPVSALAEPIRLVLTLGGLEFTDTTPRNDERFAERKKALSPYGDAGQVPLLVLPDGKTVLAQSRAILRYLGKVATYDGAPLYPTDPAAAHACDALIDLAEDMRSPIGATFAIEDQAAKEAARAALFADGGKSAKWLKVMDAVLAGDPMTTVTIGHVYAFCMVAMFRQPTFLDGVPPDCMDAYPNITKLHNLIAGLAPVKAYYAANEETQPPLSRDGFKPLPAASEAA